VRKLGQGGILVIVNGTIATEVPPSNTRVAGLAAERTVGTCAQGCAASAATRETISIYLSPSGPYRGQMLIVDAFFAPAAEVNQQAFDTMITNAKQA
jgi:hypothetical protein